MQQLTQAGQHLVNDLSHRYSVSTDAVIHMLIAVNNGGCSMAQFNCPELGGSGQWMRGGMTMVGDMFNHGLQRTVDNLCNELANGLSNYQVFPPLPQGVPGSANWWPKELGQPFSSGAQNNIRYALFPGRLAVEINNEVTVYDTLNHNIGGVSQQQGGNQSLTFSSQFGTVGINSLPIISGPGLAPAPQTNFAEPRVPTHEEINQTQFNPQPYSDGGSSAVTAMNPKSTDEIINLIEKLARLRDAGALTEDEFNTKKSELLQRI